MNLLRRKLCKPSHENCKLLIKETGEDTHRNGKLNHVHGSKKSI
jgi:hypothetical protein